MADCCWIKEVGLPSKSILIIGGASTVIFKDSGVGSLERDSRNMDRKIKEARLRAESATTEVENWSNEGTHKLEEAKRILQGCDDLKVWNICRRYSVGKSAKETAQGIEKLRNEGHSIVVADPAPPASMVSISHPPTLEFESRRHIQEDIMESLKDGNVRMIAICGPGGVGKTTMVQIIEERVRKEFAENEKYKDLERCTFTTEKS